MKQIIFTYEGYPYTNIGDYIQSIAAMQFVENPDNIIYWHRDDLNSYIGEPAKAVMNGWFTHKKENWPPSKHIEPLFLSFHINSSVYDKLLSRESLDYLKRHEPIGCRDKVTAELLLKHGINAYFSSCLTTTLGYKYKISFNKKRNGIYIVDPVHYIPEANRRFLKFWFLKDYLRHKIDIDGYINNLLSNNPYQKSWSLKKIEILAMATRSYLLLKKIIGKDLLRKSTVLTQYHLAEEIPDNQQRFKRAYELIMRYSSAELVITSRIHCALPCLGLETPVVFLQNLDDSVESICRFDGLLDLHNIIKFKRNKIVSSPCSLPLELSKIANKSNYKKFAIELIKKCILLNK